MLVSERRRQTMIQELTRDEEAFILGCREIIQNLATLREDDIPEIKEEWSHFEKLLSEIQHEGMDREVYIQFHVRAMMEAFLAKNYKVVLEE